MLASYLIVIWSRPSIWWTMAIALLVSQLYPTSVPTYSQASFAAVMVSPIQTAFLLTVLIGLITTPDILGRDMMVWRVISRLPPRKPMISMGGMALAWLLSSIFILLVATGVGWIGMRSDSFEISHTPSLSNIAISMGAAICIQFFFLTFIAILFSTIGSWGTAVIALGGLIIAQVLSQSSVGYTSLGPDVLLPATLLEINVETSQALWGFLHSLCWAIVGLILISMRMVRRTIGES